MSNFNQIVEEIRKFSLKEKEELSLLLEKYLIEGRRNKIFNSFKKSETEFKKGKIIFSSEIDSLKKSI